MGESKRRGSRSDRIKQAMELQALLDPDFEFMTLEMFTARAQPPDSAIFCGYSFYHPETDLMVSSSGSMALFVEGAFFFHDFPKAFFEYEEAGLKDMGLIFAAVWKDGEEYLVLPVDGSGNARPTFRRPSCKTLFGR